MIDAPAAAVDTVLDILSRHVPDREVRVIGSRASGQAKPFSDLDLVVMGDEPLSLHARGRLRDAFAESNLPFAIALIEWALSSDAFRLIIAERATPFREAVVRNSPNAASNCPPADRG